ncbi:putative redox protein [Thermosyntropha lipolytica DSM 11003]|uniref:Putative redox protein n=1 Tax=Thermosyntropha lipolytica DSM 11003 TaxID=1123382 RepID=A0A1M5KT50_9FIRM|nr:alpha/beta fold hydrolase [Thermosyntropha lipolytica]SHG55850.1 putative redox protein [Thermosyntropha lipolytica DSM 11003]
MEKICLSNGSKILKAYSHIFPDASGIIIICHGFRGTKENGGRIFDFTTRLEKAGFAVLAFDFTGSGESPGDFSRVTLSRQAEDLRIVIDYVKKTFSLPIILLGRSFGGTTVLAGGTEDPAVRGFILWSAPVFLPATFARLIPAWQYKLWQSGHKIELADENGVFQLEPDLIEDFSYHDMDKYIRNIGNRKTLIVHGGEDQVVPLSNAYYLTSKLSVCTLKIFKGADHKFIYDYKKREDYTINWLKQNFDKKQE